MVAKKPAFAFESAWPPAPHDGPATATFGNDAWRMLPNRNFSLLFTGDSRLHRWRAACYTFAPFLVAATAYSRPLPRPHHGPRS
jgi:hypothetical protein